MMRNNQERFYIDLYANRFCLLDGVKSVLYLQKGLEMGK